MGLAQIEAAVVAIMTLPFLVVAGDRRRTPTIFLKFSCPSELDVKKEGRRGTEKVPCAKTKGGEGERRGFDLGAPAGGGDGRRRLLQQALLHDLSLPKRFLSTSFPLPYSAILVHEGWKVCRIFL